MSNDITVAEMQEIKPLNLYQKLCLVQSELKAPKSQYNSFGKYYYRNCEDILEALKPHLRDKGLVVAISDELVEISGRFYVKATVRVIDVITKEFIENSAYAREEEVKKGCDGSQITGASSSYARKYALNGMFLIDDTKDSDTTNTGKSVADEFDENWSKYSDKQKNYLEKTIGKKYEKFTKADKERAYSIVNNGGK